MKNAWGRSPGKTSPLNRAKKTRGISARFISLIKKTSNKYGKTSILGNAAKAKGGVFLSEGEEAARRWNSKEDVGGRFSGKKACSVKNKWCGN